MSACFTSVQAYNGCAGFRPGDSDPRQNMPQQRIWWKPVPWSPSVPKTKSAKQQRKAALNTNDVFSAESLAKHKVSIADVLLSEPQAPASPAKRERAPADSAAVAASQGDAETILADESAWPALKTKTAAPPEEAGGEDDWEMMSEATTEASEASSAWELLSTDEDSWRVVGQPLTFKEHVTGDGAMAAPARPRTKAPPRRVTPEPLLQLDEDHECAAPVGHADLEYAQRQRRTKQSAASRDRRVAQKAAAKLKAAAKPKKAAK